MLRYAILIGTVLVTSISAWATANPKFDSKLIANVSKDGGVVVELILTNNTHRDVCYDYIHDALLEADDSSTLGNPHVSDIVRTSTVSVVYATGEPTTFWPDINSDGKALSPADLARLKRVTLHFEAYDCLQFFELHDKAPILYKRDLTATPTFEQ